MTVVNQFLSDIFFYISGTCWVVLLIPQLIENHKNKDSESLSLGFLWCWLIGDLFYLTGAIFQNLLWSTIWITIMYLLNDVALMGQTLYYRYTKSPISPNPPSYIASERSRLLANNTEANRATPPVDVSPRRAEDIPTSSYTSAHQNSVQSYDSKAFVNLGVSLKSILPLFLINFTILFNFTSPSSNPSHLGLLMITGKGGENNDIVWWAQLCGWISTALYTGAKLPQIHLNYTRKTCQGLSKWLFIISLLANGTFILSIVAYSTEVAFIIKSIPWIMGALGPMFLDLVILGQFYYYNKLLGNSDSDEYLA